MSLIESVCPSCHEKITVDDSRKKLFCMYCGAAFTIEDLKENHGKMVLQKDRPTDASGQVGPDAITARGAENVNATVTLYFDKKAVAKLRKEEMIVLDVAPGNYAVWARAGIEGSKKTQMDICPGDRLQILYHGLSGYEVVKY